MLHELLLPVLFVLSFLAEAPILRSMGLVLVLAGGVALDHARRPPDPRMEKGARRRGHRWWRFFGHAMIGLGVASVLVSAAYFHLGWSTAFWYDTTLDGVFMLLRFFAFPLVVLGGAFVWGGKKLIDDADPSSASIDVLVGRMVCGVGYLFIVCGFVMVTMAATKLSFSARASIPEIEKCLRDSPGLGCYFDSLL